MNEVQLQQEFKQFMEFKQRQSSLPQTAREVIGDGAKPSKEEMQQSLVVQKISKEYDIIRARATDSYYIRQMNKEGYTYDKMLERDVTSLVRDAYLALELIPTDKKIKSTVETLKTMVTQEIDAIDTNVIEVCPNLYWDGHIAQLTDMPSGPCFRRLFDNSRYASPSVIKVTLDDTQSGLIKAVHKATYQWLELLEGELPDPKDVDNEDKGLPFLTDFDFIHTWSCGDQGLYMDMLKAIASCFMLHKPKGVFVLTGLRRNGKSTFVDMLHTMFGRANTSAVRLGELSGMHQTSTLAETMMNAPDEEVEVSSLDDVAKGNFKSMAAHEPLLLNVMYSSQPQWVSTDFMCFMPMNQDPEWKGAGAAACMQRTFIIPFRADLSKFDNAGRDFKRETFTDYMFANLIGVVTAIARYYKDKPLKFSNAMESARESVAEGTDNTIEYAKLFNKWFIGYDRAKTLFDDYRAWCRQNNKSYQGDTKNTLLFAVKNICGDPKVTKINVNGETVNAYRLGGQGGRNFLTDDFFMPELQASVVQVLGEEDNRTGNSVIQGLENWLARQQVAKARVDEQ